MLLFLKCFVLWADLDDWIILKQLSIDSRWSGNFGIGRYSRELSRRLEFPSKTFVKGLIPTAPSEILRGASIFKSKKVFYSPGYIPQINFNQQIITIHDLILLESGIGSKMENIYIRAILKPLISLAKIKILTVSENSRTEISMWLNINKEDIEVIPNGISTDFLSFGNLDSGLQRGKTVMFVGNSKKHKNYGLFIDAINELGDSWEIILVGQDLETGKINPKHKYFKFNDISDYDLSLLYLRTNVLVVPSLYEGFSMPVLEGSFLGCKIVHLGVLPTIKEIIGDASFSSEKNPQALASCIELAANSNSKLSEQDRLDLPNRYSWDRSAAKLKKILSDYL